MCHLVRLSLLIMVLGMILFPAIGSAGNMTSEQSLNNSSGVNDSVSGPSSAPQQQTPELQYTDLAPSARPSTVSGESGVQGSSPSPADSKVKIQVVYDQDTEKDRGILITLIIAFGISLALNIYLATSLIAARRGM